MGALHKEEAVAVVLQTLVVEGGVTGVEGVATGVEGVVMGVEHLVGDHRLGSWGTTSTLQARNFLGWSCIPIRKYSY